MKPSSLAPALLAAMLFLSPALNAAPDQDGPPADRPMNAERHAEIIKRFDKNGDGMLDEAEKTAAKEYNREKHGERMNKAGERMRKNALAKFDKNGDGKLDESERAEIANDPKVIKRFDKNADGKLDEAEKEAAREAFVKAREKRAGKNQE